MDQKYKFDRIVKRLGWESCMLNSKEWRTKMQKRKLYFSPTHTLNAIEHQGYPPFIAKCLVPSRWLNFLTVLLPPPLIREEVSNYVYLRQIYKSRNLFMYGSFEIYNFYKFISVKVNLRWFFIFMLMYNAS